MSTMYKVKVKAPDERGHEISLRSDESRARGAVRVEHKFRGGKDDLPLILVPLDYPIYRLENYRTRDRQLSLIAEGSRPSGFFEPVRREDPMVQQAQHELLFVQAKTSSGETIKAIYDEMGRVAEQTDPLIITADGVVVNGNRRLCAMRELFAKEPVQYSSFLNVSCLVLPASATPSEILELEIGLQMQPETKLPYEWTAIGRAVRDLRKTKDPDEVARLMNRDKAEIERASRMIDAADLYLSEWLGKPDAYNLLDGTEQAFKQVATRNWGKPDETDLREQTRKFDFFLIEQRDELMGDSAYTLINTIEQNPRTFLKTVAAEWDIQLSPRQATGSHKISFDEDGSESNDLDYSPLIEILKDARKDQKAARSRVEQVAQVCIVVGEQGKEKEKAALKFARNAEKALAAISLRGADPATFGEISALLNKCQEHSEQLLGALAQQRQSKA